MISDSSEMNESELTELSNKTLDFDQEEIQIEIKVQNPNYIEKGIFGMNSYWVYEIVSS